MTNRRFIEESFPVREVSAASVREKNIRHGHISTLHIWWARRPLAASRATAYAALVPAPSDELDWQRTRDFIAELSTWENSLNRAMLDRARRDILAANGGRPPRMLDPFAGGGAIPLEALRLGCEVHASDYNPVAVLILKATLEYPQKYGHPFPGMPESPARKKETHAARRQASLFGEDRDEAPDAGPRNPLLEAVRHWGNWVLEQARKELAEFYPADPDGSVPVGYIWARTIPCQNPACQAQIPLMRQFWLAKKAKKRVALYPVPEDGRVTFHIVGDGYAPWPEGFEPEKGTVKGAVATCPLCGGTVDAKTTRRLFREGKLGQRMVAVVLTPSRSGQERRARGEGGKTYRVATEADEAAHARAAAALEAARQRLMMEWAMDPIPDEPLPPHGTLGFRVQAYGMDTWGDLFNARQRLALITFVDKVRQAHAHMLAAGYAPDFAKAVATYLGLAVSRLADYDSSLCVWAVTGGFVAHTFGRQALPFVWDYFELHPDSHSTGDWSSATAWVLRVLEHLSKMPTLQSPTSHVIHIPAAELPYPDGYFDAVLTDPPYYDNVPYSHLSDFFYVWLKRSLGHLYPDLFSTPLTPKAQEIVAYSHGEGGWEGGKRFFEENLKRAFQEMRRVLRPGGIAIIVYAHKSTEGWETVINALLDSGLVVTGAWPLHTEMQERLRSQESAALASSIYIVARKMDRRATGFYTEVREELRRHLEAKLHRLWEEGIGGADFFIAAIGSAIEVFGKYEQVIDYEGQVVRADRLLEDVRTIATDYAVRQILRNGFAGEVSDLTRFYVLWRWNYGESRVLFDEARKLAQSCGVDLTREWGRGFVRKEKEFVRVLGPQHRRLDDLEDAREMIDVLHKVLLLWEKGKRSEMVEALASSGFGRTEAFYRVAQAVSETLPLDSKEKKLLEGFLSGRERVREEVAKTAQQGRLWHE